MAALLNGCTKCDAPAPPLSPSYPISRQITYNFTLENQSPHAAHGVELWAFAPVAKTSTQRCEGIEASHPHDVLGDALGNQTLRFRIESIPPYGSRVIRIKACLSLSDTPNPTEEGDFQDFVRPSELIQSDRPEILRLAQTLSKQDLSHRSPAATPELLFDWVTRNIPSSAYRAEPHGALDCLLRKKGDCTEQALLFAALCRALRIPARVLGGYMCEANCLLKPEGYHNWAEFYQDERWHLADPQGRTFIHGPSRYIAMRVGAEPGASKGSPTEGSVRFHVRGDGIRARMN